MNDQPHSSIRRKAPAKPIPQGRIQATTAILGKAIIQTPLGIEVRQMADLFKKLKDKGLGIELGRQAHIRDVTAIAFEMAYRLKGNSKLFRAYEVLAPRLKLKQPKTVDQVYRTILQDVCETLKTASWTYCKTKSFWDVPGMTPERFRAFVEKHGIEKAAEAAGLVSKPAQEVVQTSATAASGKPRAAASKAAIVRDDAVIDDEQLDDLDESEDLDEILDCDQETEAGSAKRPKPVNGKPVSGKPTMRSQEAEQAGSVPPLSRSSAGARNPNKVNFHLFGRERVPVGEKIIITVVSIHNDENGQIGHGYWEVNLE